MPTQINRLDEIITTLSNIGKQAALELPSSEISFYQRYIRNLPRTFLTYQAIPSTIELLLKNIIFSMDLPCLASNEIDYEQVIEVIGNAFIKQLRTMTPPIVQIHGGFRHRPEFDEPEPEPEEQQEEEEESECRDRYILEHDRHPTFIAKRVLDEYGHVRLWLTRLGKLVLENDGPAIWYDESLHATEIINQIIASLTEDEISYFTDRTREALRSFTKLEKSYIQDYSYDPPEWIKHGASPWFGMELEIERSCPARKKELTLEEILKKQFQKLKQTVSKNPESLSLENFARIATIKNLTFCKYDSSIGNGFEIVTHPISLTNPWSPLEPLWPRLQTLADNGFCGTEATGLHIHITRFNDRLAEFLKVMMYASGAHFWTKLARQQRHSQTQLEEYAKFSETGTRYQAVNDTGSTVELRFFQAEIFIGHIQENIDLARALIGFATTQEKDIIAFLKEIGRARQYAAEQRQKHKYWNIAEHKFTKQINRVFINFIKNFQNDFPFAYRLLSRSKFITN